MTTPHIPRRARLLHEVPQLLSLILRRRAFDTSTPEGRSLERHRRVLLTALASGAAKGISVLTVLASVPLSVRYLGSERYGLWMTITSVIAFLQFADLGLGNGLLTAISEANGRDDREMAARYTSSAFFMLSGVAIISAVVFLAAYPSIPWQRVFNLTSPQAIVEAGPAMAAFVACFLLNMPLGVVPRVLMGYQEGFVTSIWTAGGNVLGLAGVLLAIYLRAGLPWLVLAMAGAPVLALLLNGIVLFGLQRPWLRPSLRKATSANARELFRLGLLFFVLQLALALTFSSDNIVTTQVLGPDAVAQYSVSMKLFSIAPVTLTMVLMPLWAAYGEAIARGDTAWARKTLLRSLFLAALLAALPSALLVAFGARIVSLLVGPELVPSPLLLLGLAAWAVATSAGNAVAIFLNGTHVASFRVPCALLMSATALVAKTMLASRIGLPGIIWGTVIAYVLFEAVPYALYVPRLLPTLGQRRLQG